MKQHGKIVFYVKPEAFSRYVDFNFDYFDVLEQNMEN